VAFAHTHTHTPNLNCYVLDRIEFWSLIYKNLKFRGLFGQKCPNVPPNKITGYAAGLSHIPNGFSSILP
jgi:hypothetical protein